MRIVSLLLVVIALVLVGMPGHADESGSAGNAPDVARGSSPNTLTTQFTYTATVPSVPAGAKALDLWLPLPSDSEWQTVSDVAVDSPSGYKVTREGRFGNRMVYVHADHPSLPLSISVRFTVARREVRVLDTDAAPAPPKMPRAAARLAADRLVPINGRFQTIAASVTSGQTTSIGKERAIFDHVVATMQYDYKKTSPEYARGDAAFVCDYKSGNCSDLHSYLISVSRNAGIPAVLEFGFPLTGIPLPTPVPDDGNITSYHCWVWFEQPGGHWTPEDAADARRWKDSGHPEVASYLFGNLVLARSAVAMSRGRDIVLSPPQRGVPLNYFIYPYAESDGAPVDATWQVHYHIVSQ